MHPLRGEVLHDEPLALSRGNMSWTPNRPMCIQSAANIRTIMAEGDYVLSHTADAPERERLGLIERLRDPFSQRHLAALGIRQGWHCLEVGAGPRWLAEQVGPRGRVVATDINPRFLTEIEHKAIRGGRLHRDFSKTLPREVVRSMERVGIGKS
jgi:hypothetical protein